LCGKWHLGSKPDWGPNHFGFDHSYGSLAGGVGPWDHRYKLGEFTQTWQRNGTLIEEPGHVTDLLTAEAIRWLTKRGQAPFFLYVPYSAVHIPIREPEGYLRRVPPEITDPSQREYLACVLHLDDAVGQLLAALQQTGKADSTIVVFTSDNGGVNTARNDAESYPADNYTPGTAHGNNQPLRGQKGSVYEGGIRVPTLVRWPGNVPVTSSAEPVHITDWMPTFCRLSGYQPDRDLHWDGRDLTPHLTGAGVLTPRTIYVAGPGFKELALREGDWKLVVHQDKPASRGALAMTKLELFNLAKDPNETTDLSARQPDRVQELLTKLRLAAAADHTATVAE
jgi:arylsulfatase A-like enzyme